VRPNPAVLAAVLSGRRRSESLGRMVAGLRSALLAAFPGARTLDVLRAAEPVPFRMPRKWTTIA
jgi:hypothetical protein